MVDPQVVGPEEMSVCGIGCLIDRDNPGYLEKTVWLEERFKEGLRYLLSRDEHGRPLGFLEYVPGESAWRPVDAKGWIFIHCLWVFPRGRKVGDLGRRLIDACVAEADRSGATGVAVMVSDGPWMAGPGIFLRCGFTPVAEQDRFQILIHRLRDGPEPAFRDISGQASAFEGLHLVYAGQCPLLHRSVTDLARLAAEQGVELKITRLESAREAQDAPSYYGVYSLIWNGRVLSDHYVSGGRFRNLLRKVVLAEGGTSGG